MPRRHRIRALVALGIRGRRRNDPRGVPALQHVP